MLNQITDDSPFYLRMSQFALDPVDLRRNLLLMLKVHFSDPNHYGPMFELRDIYYKGADSKDHDNLHLSLNYVEGDKKDLKNVSRIPAIHIEVEDWDFQQNDIGNFNTVDSHGNPVYRKQVSTACRVRHFSRSADTSLMLATQSAGFLSAQSQYLKEAWQLAKFDIVKLTKPQLVSIPNDEEKTYEVDVFLQLAFNFVWTVYSDSKLIKTISFAKALEL